MKKIPPHEFSFFQDESNGTIFRKIERFYKKLLTKNQKIFKKLAFLRILILIVLYVKRLVAFFRILMLIVLYVKKLVAFFRILMLIVLYVKKLVAFLRILTLIVLYVKKLVAFLHDIIF